MRINWQTLYTRSIAGVVQSVNATSASIVWAGQTATIIINQRIAATAASIAYAGQTAIMLIDARIAATAAGITYAGQQPVISIITEYVDESAVAYADDTGEIYVSG